MYLNVAEVTPRRLELFSYFWVDSKEHLLTVGNMKRTDFIRNGGLGKERDTPSCSEEALLKSAK